MKILLLIGLGALASPAAAEVVSASSNGFEVRQTVPLVVKPEVAFQAFANLPAWWNPQHTYGGKSENLSFALTPGGCFCERLPGGGGVEHMRVTYVDPGKRVVLEGALGPLLYEAVAGVMDVQIKPRVAGGSTITLNYRASGFAKGGADRLAPLVDSVLGSQIDRLADVARKSR